MQIVREQRDLAVSVEGASFEGFFRETYEADGSTAFFKKMPDLQREPWDARGECELERLDTPGIARIDPWPHHGDYERLLKEMKRRIRDWEKRFSISDMPTDRLAGNLWAVWHALAHRDENEAQRDWLIKHELFRRMGALCVRLPAEHPFRGGEFCD